jgi:5-methylcytosine-specific restriction endonuclease McrA
MNRAVRNKTPEARAISSAHMKRLWEQPEFRARMSERSKQMLQDPAFRARFLQKPGTPWRGDRIKGDCHYCGAPAGCRDHRIPKSRGGTDDPANIVLACRRCNTSKGRLTEQEFMEARRLMRLRSEPK